MAVAPRTQAEHSERRRAMLPFPEVLSETAQLLLLDTDPDTLCQAVFRTLREPFGIDVYLHYLASPDRTYLELASSAGSEAVRAAIGTKVEFGSGVCGTVARQCSPIYLPDLQNNHDPMTEYIRDLGIRVYACHPLIIEGRLLGTLSFGSTTRESFTAQELDLFSLVAKQVTLATDRRMQGERVRQLERLATAGRMSATLAHEVNNPLESLANLLYLLRSEVHGTDGTELLDEAQAQVVQLSKIVQRTLDIFRGRRETPRVLDVSQLVHDLLTGLTLPQNARLESEVEGGLCVRGVPGELRQVLFNLLTNAAHFSRPGTPVTLWVRRAGDNAEIRVRDEGPGISDETRRKLFQPFYTTRKSEGTGIGLWLSKEILEHHGGSLTFHSNPKERPGTEFIATLPIVTN